MKSVKKDIGNVQNRSAIKSAIIPAKENPKTVTQQGDYHKEKVNPKKRVSQQSPRKNDENLQNKRKNSLKNDNKKIPKCDVDKNNKDKIIKENSKETAIIPEVLRKQGAASYCSSTNGNNCPCNTLEAVEHISKEISYTDRRNWISCDRLHELRRKAQDSIKTHKVFTIRGCFFTIRTALTARGWVEKLDAHRKHTYGHTYGSQVTYEDLAQSLPKRRPGETRRQYLIKCERSIMSRFLEHVAIDFLWTARKEKCDWIDQAKNPLMVINKFHRVPFTTKEGLCSQLRDFHWFYEEGMSELYFPRCYNVWSPEELNDFITNFRITACIGFLKCIVHKYRTNGCEKVFTDTSKIPITAIEFAFKRCHEFMDACNHIDIDIEEPIRIWEHDWDGFLTHHYLLTHDNSGIQFDSLKRCETIIVNAEKILDQIKVYLPQYNLDGYLNIWIVKPANKCRGRGISLMNDIKKIMTMVNPPIATKARFVVQKYIERPLIIHNTKFDIRQWFLITSVQPLVIWMYKESYLRFSSQEYNLKNYHESVHLTNHAVQKKYSNGKRDERLPNENMWDCYTFQAYLRQIGEYGQWAERIYPGMQRAIIGTMLASQENMDRRSNTFELFGADFMISEDFYPWLIEINSSPDFAATTSVTARMCPQCLEDIIKVVIDRKADPKVDTGNFEIIYRQVVPPTPAYMGLNLCLKGQQITPKSSANLMRKDRSSTSIPHKSSLYQHTISVSRNLATAHQFNYNPDAEVSEPVILNLMKDFKNSLFKENGSLENTKKSVISSINSNTLRHETLPNLNNSKMLEMISSISKASKGTQSTNSFPFTTKLNEKRFSQPNTFKFNFIPQKSASRRNLSCGPRLITNSEIDEISATKQLNTIIDNKKIECVGSKCNSDNLNKINLDTKTNSSNMKSIKPQKNNLNKLNKLNLKSKSARTPRSDRLPIKTAHPSSSNYNNNNNKRQCKNHNNNNNNNNKIVTKSDNSSKNNSPKMNTKKNSVISNSGSQSSPSSVYRVGMSLRAWRAKRLNTWKGANSATPLHHKTDQTNNIQKNSPKKELCKNLSKKIIDCVA